MGRRSPTSGRELVIGATRSERIFRQVTRRLCELVPAQLDLTALWIRCADKKL